MSKPAYYAVMGNPIAHSLSPQIHQQFARQCGISLCYEKLLIEPDVFEKAVIDFFAAGGRGLNVTLPFKTRAFALADFASKRAQQAAAANTLWMESNKLHADNTDGIGLVRDLAHYLDIRGKSILILGAGGATRGIIGPLLDANPITIMVANRTLANAEALQAIFPAIQCCALDAIDGSYDLVINATSANTTNQTLVLPSAVMTKKPFCYDLAYSNKGETLFTQWAIQQGSKAVDGLGMLKEQAAEAFFCWHGIRPKSLDDTEWCGTESSSLDTELEVDKHFIKSKL